jgi:mitochondrial distribution and morphology protein 31
VPLSFNFMATIPLIKSGAGSAITILRCARAGAAIDRYNVIRNFFRHQITTSTPSKSILLQHSRLHQSSLRAPALCLSTRLVGVHFHTRHFHPTLLRQDDPMKPMSEDLPKSPPHKELDAPAERCSSTQEPLREVPDPAPPPTPTPPTRDTRYLENYSRFFQQLVLSVPHPHRPTRDDLLNVATNFWQRLRIRFKWFTIKSFRKFNADDISAFVTWFLMSQTLWILVGT